MKNIKVLALGGRAGAGKTTVRKMFPSFMALAFADPLKEMLCVLLEPNLVYTQNQDIKNNTRFHELGDQTLRHAMRTLGTEWGRKTMHQDIWTRNMDIRIQTYHTQVPGTVFVVDDVRFDSEVECLKKYDTFFLEIFNPRIPELKPNLLHPSESLDYQAVGFNRVVNGGTVIDLEHNVKDEINLWFWGRGLPGPSLNNL